jgi:hypothetical protein
MLHRLLARKAGVMITLIDALLAGALLVVWSVGIAYVVAGWLWRR